MIRNCEIQIFFFPKKTAEAEGVHPTYSLRVPKVTKLVNWRFGPGSAQYPTSFWGQMLLKRKPNLLALGLLSQAPCIF